MEITPNPTPHRRRRRRLLGLLVVLTAAATLGAASYSLAIFTSTATVGANTFTNGTIVLGTNPATALLTAGAMMPGDTVNGALVLSNTGTSQLRYAMTSTSTNSDGKGLANQLVPTIKTLGTSCAAFDGTTVYAGPLAGAAFGNPAPGAQAGDRTLNAGSSETLCFAANLPTSTGNAFQGATTTASFTFDAEQTANNP
ncbi:MAG: TasA family protein [Candidatus Limnocylindrales bacterium]